MKKFLVELQRVSYSDARVIVKASSEVEAETKARAKVKKLDWEEKQVNYNTDFIKECD